MISNIIGENAGNKMNWGYNAKKLRSPRKVERIFTAFIVIDNTEGNRNTNTLYSAGIMGLIVVVYFPSLYSAYTFVSIPEQQDGGGRIELQLVKNICSKAKILPQNNKWRKTVKVKGNDTMPESKESLERKGKGPLSRNFDIPKAAENRLSKKVPTVKQEKEEPAAPSAYSAAENPCVSKMIASDICT